MFPHPAPGTPQPLSPSLVISRNRRSRFFPNFFLPPPSSSPRPCALLLPPPPQLLPLRSHLAARGAAPPAVRRCWEAGGRRGALPGQVRCVGTAPGPRSPLRRPPAAWDHYLAACPPGPVSAERDPGITITQVPAAAQRACAGRRAGAGIWRCPALPSRPRTRSAGLTPPATPTAFYSRAPSRETSPPLREHARPGRLLRTRCVAGNLVVAGPVPLALSGGDQFMAGVP